METRDEHNETVQALIALLPGITEEELLADAETLAEQLEVTPEEILDLQRAEAEESAAAASAAAEFPRAATRATNVKLGNAVRKGDIFTSPASTLFIQHGHSGIFGTQAEIVEAPGLNQVSRRAEAKKLTVGKGTVKQYVKTTQAKRDKAANYAYYSMINKPYNINFANNKHVPDVRYNCSQLVWGAYKHTTGIDLDGNGGLGVYPYNIKDSSKTVTYKTL